MKAIAIAFTWALLVFSVAHAVPVRPLFEPEPPPKLAVPMFTNLSGSAWLGKYNALPRIFVFETDGTLSYSSTAGKTLFKNRGSWKVDGNVLIFEHNIGANKVMDFKGVIQDADTIVGESITKTGVKAQQTLKRTFFKK